MRRLFWICGILGALGIGALVLLPSLANVEQFRGVLRAEMQKQLAREVEFTGMHLKLWPLSIALDQLSIAEAPDFPTGRPFVKAREIRVRVNLMALLGKNVHVEEFEIVEPALELVRDGERWNYLTLGRSSSSDQPAPVRLKLLDVTGGTLAISELGKSAARTLYPGIHLTLRGVEPGRPFTMTAASNLGLRFAGQGNPLKGKLSAANVSLPSLLRMERVEGRLSGEADVDSRDNTIFARGQLALEEARYRGAPLTAPPLKADFGLSFNSGTAQTHIESLKLRLGAAGITVTGGYPKLHVKSERIPFGDLTRVATAFDIKIPTGVSAKGQVAIDLTTDGVSAAGTIRATNLELSGASLRQPVRTPDLTLEITPDLIRSRDFVAETADARLQADFELRDYAGKSPTVDAVIRSDSASIPDLLRLARAYGVSAVDSLGEARGTASLDLRVTGPVLQVSLLRFSGKGLLKDATVRQATVDQANFDFVGDSIQLTAGQFRYQDFTLQNLRTTVKLLGEGQLRLDPLVADLFGGHHTGAVTVDNREKFTKLHVQSKLDRMDANLLISRFTGWKQIVFGQFSAEGDLTLSLNEDIARSLAGNLQLKLGEGKIAGFNLLDEVAGLGRFLGWVKRKEQYTGFVEIAGALRLSDGMATTDALRLRLDKAIVDTTGAFNLLDQTLKMRTVTTLGREFSDEVGGTRIGGFLNTAFSTKTGELVIPAIVTGSVAKPKFAPDAEAMARMRVQQFEPEKAKQQIEKIFDIFRKKK